MSRHPMFPGVVALWLGALLALGSLAAGTGLVEQAVLVLHIEKLVPAAAPPLGLTARLLVALGAGLAGAAGGFVLARLIARKGRPAGEHGREAAPAQQTAPAAPSDDNDDLARLDAARERATPRRRALSLEHDPAHAPSVLRIDDLADVDESAPQAQALPAEQELDIEILPAEPFDASTPAPEAATPCPQRSDDSAVQHLRAAPLDSLGLADLVARFAIALTARRARSAQIRAPEAVAEPEPVPVPEAGPAEAILAAPAPAAQPLAPFAPPAAAPVIARAEPETPAAQGPRSFDMPRAMRQPGMGNIEWFDADEEEATLESLLPPKRPSLTAPHRAPPLAEADPGASVAAQPAGWDVPEAEDPAEDEDEAEQADPPFSSLLDINPAHRPAQAAPFVRIEEEPAAGDVAEPIVVFPGQTVPPPPIPARLPGAPFGASPVQTEAALREALAALQKMSGAA